MSSPQAFEKQEGLLKDMFFASTLIVVLGSVYLCKY